MQELEKILEEIGELRGQAGSECTSEDHYIKKAWEHCLDRVVGIIRKHMNDSQCGECSRRRWYQIGYKDGKRMNDGWIPVGERLPEEAGTYIVNALNGERSIVTFAKWKNRYKRFDMTGARAYWRVNAWHPLPEPYRPERSRENEK